MRLLFCKSVKNADGAVLASRLHFRAVGHRDGFCLGSLGATRLGVGIAVIVIVVYGGCAFPCPKQYCCSASDGGCGVESRIVIPLVVFLHIVEVEVSVTDVAREVLLLHHIIADAAVVFWVAWIVDGDGLMVDAPIEV